MTSIAVRASLTIEIRQHEDKSWEWSIYSANGRLIAVSGTRYKHKQHCVDQVKNLFEQVRTTQAAIKEVKKDEVVFL